MKLLAILRRGIGSIARDVIGLTGCALVALGVGMIYLPAGLICAGAMLVMGVILTAKPR